MQHAIKRHVKGLTLSVIAMSFFLTNCYAGVTLTGTRIVFIEGQNEKIVRTSNKGEQPALVQVWVDESNSTVEGIAQEVPFMAIPPLFRMEPGKGQSVRVRYLGQDLPKDRESLFWFNLLEVPPRSDEEVTSERLTLAFKTKIKLFYRPVALTETSADQGNKLQWRQAAKGELTATNPTPYYLSFYSVGVRAEGVTQELASPMLAPFSEQKLVLPSALRNKKITEINFELINDYGNGVNYQAKKNDGKGFIVNKK
ncbi:fimbria/pilus periplasmic chaperone [Rosenbergiella collisarenosi]|uniref:fimbrial biogenesis chaperone n=1 Tax=Rosenbergiella collisarenosi TaxID=1544695 RepID=UPI001BDB66AC|nr:fimbria/pilus periplasmic chaperone [Rosenbergiella collisarenosi]MBT0722616.1 fimbria/pilus periplasmic chaperone [Rosenbergiella collisarenosi]